MGGDGPHYSPSYPYPLHRNSSVGLATLRPDGFIAVAAAPVSLEMLQQDDSLENYTRQQEQIVARGKGRTNALLVTGPRLIVTADTSISGSRLTISAYAMNSTTRIISPELQHWTCETLTMRNVTDKVLAGCSDLPVGIEVELGIIIEGATRLYMIGFQSNI